MSGSLADDLDRACKRANAGGYLKAMVDFFDLLLAERSIDSLTRLRVMEAAKARGASHYNEIGIECPAALRSNSIVPANTNAAGGRVS